MNITIFDKIEELKDLWNILYNKGKLRFFQSYEWNYLQEINFYGQRYVRYRNSDLIYIVIENEAILPIVINKTNKIITLLGQDESSDYLSIIFGDSISTDMICKLLSFVFAKYQGYEVIFDRINENNLLQSELDNLRDNKYIVEKEIKDCVLLDTASISGTFYDSLSKSVRQNYRTAKNRISKNGSSYKIIIQNTPLSLEESEELYFIYKERRQECDNVKGAWFINLVKKILNSVGVVKKEDVLSAYSISNHTFLAKILIDGNIAAFCEGNYDNDNVLTIARVATNKDYYTYSPGQILLIETIEELKNKIKTFDLTRGTEDYKFKLGGEVHHNYCYKIKMRNTHASGI